jgi:hypothetical protein
MVDFQLDLGKNVRTVINYVTTKGTRNKNGKLFFHRMLLKIYPVVDCSLRFEHLNCSKLFFGQNQSHD